MPYLSECCKKYIVLCALNQLTTNLFFIHYYGTAMWAHPMQECPRPPWPPEWMLIFSVCQGAQYRHILCSAKVKMKREFTWWSVVIVVCLCVVLQCFDTVVWVSGRAGWHAKIEWWGVGVVICLECGADCLHMVQLMPLPSQNPIIFCLI